MDIEARPGAGRRLSAAELAFEASADEGLVQELIAAGLIHPDDDGRHEPADVARLRLAHALASGGISVDDLAHQIRTGSFPFAEVPRLGLEPQPTGRTFAEFAGSFGAQAELLPEVYAAFGLGVPPPETAMHATEEAAVSAFIHVWSMVDDRPELFTRAARIAGEGVRHLVVGSLDLFDEFGGSPPQRMGRGLSVEEAVEPSLLQGGMMNLVLAWLRERHMEHEVFERIVSFTERSLAEAGRKPPRPDDPPAIAFVDLTGYTERTVQAGDELAAQDAAALQTLAQAAGANHGGRVIKLLGDGVMLRFGSAVDAVAGVRGLMAAIIDADLPPPHAGIAAGRFVVRDGDVFGHTVNLASRIAAHSQAGELLVTADAVERLRAAGIATEDAGEVGLKGIGDHVRLARVLT